MKSPVPQVLQGIVCLLLINWGAWALCSNIAIYNSLDPVHRELTFCKHCLKKTTDYCSQSLTVWNKGSNLVKSSKFRAGTHSADSGICWYVIVGYFTEAFQVLLPHNFGSQKMNLCFADIHYTSLHKDKPNTWQSCNQQIMSNRSRKSLSITKSSVTSNHQVHHDCNPYLHKHF